MIKLRQMAAAFLFNGEEVLMMKRSPERELAPGLWAPVGGHLEPHEMSQPRSACLREIKEETGITEAKLTDFKLKYIILRQKESEIRLQYIFFGNSQVRFVTITEEGELYWKNKTEVLELKMATTTRFVLEHYFETGAKEEDVFVGTLGDLAGSPSINWAPLRDWEN